MADWVKLHTTCGEVVCEARVYARSNVWVAAHVLRDIDENGEPKFGRTYRVMHAPTGRYAHLAELTLREARQVVEALGAEFPDHGSGMSCGEQLEPTHVNQVLQLRVDKLVRASGLELVSELWRETLRALDV